MIGVITGDVMHSQKLAPEVWLPELKKVLSCYGSEPVDWEIYRGDSFQLVVRPANALEAAFLIKACMKSLKPLDVRMAIGIGEKTYKALKVTESMGSAFVFSGMAFDKMKKRTLVIRTPWEDLDETLNLMLDLAALSVNRWRPSTARVVKATLEHPELTQKQLAERLGKPQGNISAALRRAGFHVLENLMFYYRKKIIERCPDC